MGSLNHFSKQTDVIGVPYNFGQPKLGVKNGPKSLREGGLIRQLIEQGHNVHDTGDLKFDEFVDDPATPSNVKRPKSVGAANEKIADAVERSLRQGHQCMVLGGDHSLAIGSIAGQARVQPNVGIIWVDAHGDINPPTLSPSGNVHGMPLAFLAHELRSTIPGDLPAEFSWLKPCIYLKDIVYIGIRDLDQAEKDIMDENKMKVYTMEDIRKLGIEEVVRLAVEHVSPNGSRPIHVSYDVDGVDPAHTPSTGTPVPGGLTLTEGIYIMEQIGKTGQVAVMDVAEVNPELGSAEDKAKTLDSTNQIVAGWFRTRKTAVGS